MDYDNRFNNQTHDFLHAIEYSNAALDEEMYTAIRYLNLKTDDILFNAFAGGIPLNKYIDNKLNVKYLEFDTNKEFAKNNIQHYTINNIPIKSNSVDKIICLATLHHFNNRERLILYNEFHRILKCDGLLIIGDVIEHSPQAKWLNIFVNKYNINGHNGIFFSHEDSHLLETVFKTVDASIEKYNWKFINEDNLVKCFKLLFGLNMLQNCNDDTFLLKNIQYYLQYYLQYNESLDHKSLVIPWKLIYFSCKK
jgi:SAM-dependent methyltransferase